MEHEQQHVESDVLVTLAVVRDRLSRLTAEINDMRDDMRRAAGTPHDVAALAARVDELEAWQTWAMRLVLGVVIAAVVGLVVYATGPSGGVPH